MIDFETYLQRQCDALRVEAIVTQRRFDKGNQLEKTLKAVLHEINTCPEGLEQACLGVIKLLIEKGIKNA
jgi:hypothetical protein